MILTVSSRVDIDNLSKIVVDYLIKHKSTYRTTAIEFGVSKSTVLKYVERMEWLDMMRYVQARKVVEWNISQRAFRGGSGTRMHWEKVRGENM
jgi:putative DeoR family transcriptional regulator (stage III sporulation protein D)